MPAICLLKTNRLPTDTDILISSLPFGSAEQERLLSMKNTEAQRLSLCAWLSLFKLMDHCGYADLSLSVLRTPMRKPYFKDIPVCFSVSHADELACSVVSHKNVGIDLEWLDSSRSISAISKRFFTYAEQMLLRDSTDPILEFYSIWTKKEAYSKLNGKGLVDVCSASIPDGVTFCQYLIELNDKHGILSVCCESDGDVSIYDPYDDITIKKLL